MAVHEAVQEVENETPQEIRQLAFWEKVSIGGLGALTPVVLNLVAVDLVKVFSKVTLLVVLCYLLKVVTLFYLGGIVAFMHRKENDRLKLFELGIIAPALITALLNSSYAHDVGNNGGGAGMTQGVGGKLSNPPFRFNIMPAAYNQDSTPTQQAMVHSAGTPPSIPVKQYSPPDETSTEQVLRGIGISTRPRVWFVVVGSYSSRENAEKQAEVINKQWGTKFTASVYSPYETPNFTVVIGENLTLQEARKLRFTAINSGLARDAFMKRGPTTTTNSSD